MTRHCDDYIRDKAQPKCLRMFLLYHRVPAVWGAQWRERGWPIPALFATLRCPTPEALAHVQKFGGSDGERVRVTMASRFGDVGIGKVSGGGYFVRVPVEWLTEFSEEEYRG